MWGPGELIPASPLPPHVVFVPWARLCSLEVTLMCGQPSSSMLVLFSVNAVFVWDLVAPDTLLLMEGGRGWQALCSYPTRATGRDGTHSQVGP